MKPIRITEGTSFGPSAGQMDGRFVTGAREPTGIEVFRAVQQSETITGNLMQWIKEPGVSETDAVEALKNGWNAQEALKQKLTEEPVWGDDIDAHNKMLMSQTPEVFDYWDQALTRERHNNETMNQAGLWSTLGYGLFTNALDPFSAGINLATGPIMGATRAARFMGMHNMAKSREAVKMRDAYNVAKTAGDVEKAGRIQNQFYNKLGGKSAGQVFRQSALPATLDASMAEYLAQESQPTREWEESMLNIAGTVGFTGILAGASVAYNKFIPPQIEKFITVQERKRGVQGIKAAMEGEDGYAHPATEARYQAVGSAQPPIYDPSGKLTGDPDVRARLLEEHGGDTPEFRNAWWKEQQEHTRMGLTGKDGTGLWGLNWVWRLHPSARLATTLNPEVRVLGEMLLESDYMYDAILRGDRSRLQSVEGAGRLDIHQGKMDTYDATMGSFKAILRKEFPNQPEKLQGQITHNKLWNEFNQEVSAYMYDPDHVFSTKFEPYSDEVIDAALGVHSKVYKIWEQRKVDAGIIESKATPSGQRVYANRRWNVNHARQNTMKLDDLLHEEYQKALQAEDALPEHRVSINQGDMFAAGPTRSQIIWGIGDGTGPDAARWRAQLGPGYEKWAREAVEFHENMTGSIEDFIDRVKKSKLYLEGDDLLRKNPHLKTRVSIPTKRLLEVDSVTGQSFLMRDVMQMSESYLQETAPDYYLRTMFNDDGELTETMRRVSNTYDTQIGTLKELRDATDDATATKSYQQEIDQLTKEQGQVTQDISKSIKTIKGQIGHLDDPDSVLSKAHLGIRTLNFLNYLGGMTLSALTDFAYVVMKTGLGPAFGALASRFTRSINKDLGRGGITKADLNDLAVVTEWYLHGKIKNMLHVEEGANLNSRVDRWANHSSSIFSMASGMTGWNHTLKEIAATAHLIKMRRALAGGVDTTGNLKRLDLAEKALGDAKQTHKFAATNQKKRRAAKARMDELEAQIEDLMQTAAVTKGSKDAMFLRSMGLDQNDQDLIRRMWDTHGVQDAGIDAPNISKWSDPRARQTIRRALLRATDSAIVTPTAGSLPFMMRQPWGKLVFQFQSFPVTVMEKVVLPAAQRFPDGKPEILAGIGMALSMGALVSVLKDLAKGNEPDVRPAHLARQSLDRSGLFGPYMTGLRPLEDLAGLDRVLPEGFADEHRSRDPITEFMGAWYRTASDYQRVLGGAFRGETDTQGFASSVRRQIPFNNLFYIDWLSRSAQEWITGDELK